MTAPTAEGFVATLHDLRAPEELPVIRRRLAPGDGAIGMRMRDVFAAARAARAMPLEEVGRLFASPLYEVRLGALCLLDLRARDRRTGDAGKQRLCDLYLGHHDRITTWDMVDRAAPSVVGGALLTRPVTPLHELAAAGDPLRRRTAVTAPLAFVRWGDDQHLAEVFPLAARLAADPDPLVHKAVGILLEHAGGRAPGAVAAFLDEHAGRMPRAAVRTASAKLPPGDRARFVGGAARGGPARR
ncbi:3-methyladenine DNA glycosylase AlkD [Geodermatophilus obscurus]|uniref:3-methyladenine DNA glycosylase AlkD n=1 Tax=Geodermatophilus obscurus TaxID=1861 RepID=A0A1I5CIK5_9ACTN|nr:DNA alkylation repair protein [Geodermatophilus obscurus]SFN86727.1 3-methyladenine DNA glycosylase AlkD [Geodermatophilus obscurus]